MYLAGCTSRNENKVYSLINMKYAKNHEFTKYIENKELYTCRFILLVFFLEWKHFKNSNVNFYYKLCCICCFDNI